MLNDVQKKYRKEMKRAKRENPEYFVILEKYQRGTSSLKRKTVYGISVTGLIILCVRISLFILPVIQHELGLSNGYGYQSRGELESLYVKDQVIEEIRGILDIYKEYVSSDKQVPEYYYNMLNEDKTVYAKQLKEVFTNYFQQVTDYYSEEDYVMRERLYADIKDINIKIQNAITDICNKHDIQVSFSQDDADNSLRIVFSSPQ